MSEDKGKMKYFKRVTDNRVFVSEHPEMFAGPGYVEIGKEEYWSIKNGSPDSYTLADIQDKRVFTFINQNKFRALITRLKEDGILEESGRADIGTGLELLIDKYLATGGLSKRPASPKKHSVTGADYVGDKSK